MVRIAFLAALVALSAPTTTTAWSVIPPQQQQSMKKAFGAVALSAALIGAPLVAGAHDFTGLYADPKHPNCLREISVTDTGTTLRGTDGTPGCPVDGSGKKWSLDGKVEGNDIFVDFSPKGGPKDLKGTWQSTPAAGIRWPDNNLWALKGADTLPMSSK